MVPFLTAGYPSLEATLEMMRGLDRAGVAAIELGVPFSDPIADGPDIQRASEWAIRAGVGLGAVLELVREFRRASSRPVVVMTYTNPVVHHGAERFAREAREAGVDGVILSDLPVEELPELWASLDREHVDTILLVAPTTDATRLPRLLERSRGFVYCLARTGVTGQGGGDAGSLEARLTALRAATRLPIAVGFGISSPADAAALRGRADAVIVGAAFMRRIHEDPAAGAVGRVVGFGEELVRRLS